MFGLGKVHHVTCKKAETIFVEARQGWTGSPTRNKSIRRRNFASPVASETSGVCGTSRQCAVHFEYRVCIPIYARSVERYKIRLLYKCFRKDVRRPGSCSSRLLWNAYRNRKQKQQQGYCTEKLRSQDKYLKRPVPFWSKQLLFTLLPFYLCYRTGDTYIRRIPVWLTIINSFI